ncbi:MAG TPA: preprotein translocase subunit YajC, partial [Verrucomicrobiae bacterium]|nr:preprotein translocase subunit YajC [Verrucomicrobiae bacterium]
MKLLKLGVMLAMGQQATPGTQPDPRAQALQMVLMLGLMAVMFYFVLIRPQSKKAKDHEAMLKTVRPGDKIITSGGVV